MKLTDQQLDDLWLFRGNIHDGDLTLQLRDYARNVIDLHTEAQGSQFAKNVYTWFREKETQRLLDKAAADFAAGDLQQTGCPHCNRPWSEHEFGVPSPYCP